jgi:hypothetical protein
MIERLKVIQKCCAAFLLLTLPACSQSGEVIWSLFPGSDVEVDIAISESTSMTVDEESMSRLRLEGTCTLPGQDVYLKRPALLSRSIECSDEGTWETWVDLSEFPDGEIQFEFELERIIDASSSQLNLTVVKLTHPPTAPANFSGTEWISSSILSSGYPIRFDESLDSAGRGSVQYQVCIGSAPQNCDIISWRTLTSIELDSGLVNLTGITLNEAQAIYFSIRAVDAVSQTSDSIFLGPIGVDLTAPIISLLSISTTDTYLPNVSQNVLISTDSPTGNYSEWCMLENAVNLSDCLWVSGELPHEYTSGAIHESLYLSVWLRDAAGNVSVRYASNTLTSPSPSDSPTPSPSPSE